MKQSLPRNRRLSTIKKGVLTLSSSFVTWFSIILFLLLTGLALFSTAYMKQAEVVFFKLDAFPLTLLFAALLFGFFLLLFRHSVWDKISIQSLRTTLVAYALILGTTWVFMSRSQPFADAGMVYEFAQWFLAGDFSPIAENYLGHFPYQLSLALYYELAMRLVGPDAFYFLQMVNVAGVALSYFLLTSITAELFENKAVQFFACLLLFGCLPPLIFVTFVYGTQIGLTLSLLAICLLLRYLRTRKSHLLLLLVPTMALAVLIKQNYWIFVIAISITLVLDCITQPKKIIPITLAALLAACMLAPQLVYWSYEMRSGYKIEPASPAILHIAMGMQEGERAPGWFNGYVLTSFDGVAKNYEEARTLGQKDIAERLGYFVTHPAQALTFYAKKIVSQWCDPTFGSIQVSYFGGRNIPPLGYIPTSLYWGGLRGVAEGYMDVYLWFIYAGCFACFVHNRKKLSFKALFPILIVIGGFLFHILWEAKSQYCWPYFVLCIPYAANGLYTAMGRLSKNRATHLLPRSNLPQ